MKWRIMKLEVHDAYLNMGTDQAIMESVEAGKSAPTIRFYKWMPSAVSIGRFQSMQEEVDIEKCKELGVSYIRRVTGGGAVYHSNSGEITYSVIAPVSIISKDIRESYRIICGWVIDGLSKLGINASFAPINDIVVDGKKISGNAQTRSKGIILQHGTILYDLDIKTMFTVLRVSEEKISDKLIKSVEDRVTCARNYADISLEGLYEKLLEGFTVGKEFGFNSCTEDEMKRADTLAKSVYSSDSWNFDR